MQAIILAGGFGTRLQSVIKDVPKPMADIDGMPFLCYIFLYLKKYNITNIVLSVHYLNEKIINFFGDSYLGINIKYAIEEEPLGTGGAILNSLKYINQNRQVIIINGDTFLQIDYQELANFHNHNNSDLTMVLRDVEDASRYGCVKINDDKQVINFTEKNIEKKSGFINGGIYILNPQIFSNYNLLTKFSFEQDFLSKFINLIKPYAFISNDYFIDIGIPEDYQKAQIDIPQILKNKALFLDRDGVINIDYGHVGKIEDFHFVEEIFEICQRAQNKGYLIIIVTNQAGIAKGKYSEEQFLELTKWMENEFLSRGIKIAKTYYCPYHIDAVIDKYRQDSYDRKPNPGMILKALKEFNIDPQNSILIGDKDTDIQAGNLASIKNNFLVSNDINIMNFYKIF
jgi:D,D-heptose 1,7-bisphosphate phosphatase